MARTQHGQNDPLVPDLDQINKDAADREVNEASDHPRFDSKMNANMQKRDEGKISLEQDASPHPDQDRPNGPTIDRPLDPEADRRRLKTEALRKRDKAVDRHMEKQELAAREQQELKDRNKKEDTSKVENRKAIVDEQRKNRKDQ